MAQTKVKAHRRKGGIKVKAHSRVKPRSAVSQHKYQRSKLRGKLSRAIREKGDKEKLLNPLKWQIKRAGRIISNLKKMRMDNRKHTRVFRKRKKR